MAHLSDSCIFFILFLSLPRHALLISSPAISATPQHHLLPCHHERLQSVWVPPAVTRPPVLTLQEMLLREPRRRACVLLREHGNPRTKLVASRAPSSPPQDDKSRAESFPSTSVTRPRCSPRCRRRPWTLTTLTVREKGFIAESNTNTTRQCQFRILSVYKLDEITLVVSLYH